MKSTARKIKEKFFHSSPVFGQLIGLIRQANVENVILKAKSDKHSKKFKKINFTQHKSFDSKCMDGSDI